MSQGPRARLAALTTEVRVWQVLQGNLDIKDLSRRSMLWKGEQWMF